MNKNTILLLQVCLLTASLPAMAQHEEPVLASVTYQFVHVNDTGNRANPIRTDMILRLGQTNSRYTNADLENDVKASKKKVAERTAAGPVRVVSGMPMAVVMSHGINTEELFQLPKENKLIRTSSLGIQDYVIEMPLPKIDWEIGNETKVIGKFTCQKATGTFAGRTYTAWFTSELPFQNGPWKLCGLPGLILEAKDSKNEVFFLFKEIARETNNERITSNVQRPVKVSEESFSRAKKAFDQNPAASMQSQLKDNAAVETYYRDASGKLVRGEEARKAIKKDAKIKNNNPVELTKN